MAVPSPVGDVKNSVPNYFILPYIEFKITFKNSKSSIQALHPS